MHELAIAEGIIESVTSKLPDARITQVNLEIGVLSGVVGDSLLFCFDLATEGTALAGASLEISEPEARCYCRDCQREFSPDGPIPVCGCGSADVKVLAGEELRILSVRVA